MQRERPAVPWIPLAVLVALTVALRPETPPPPPVPAPVVSGYEQLENAIELQLRRADAAYRLGDPATSSRMVCSMTANGDYDTLTEQYAELAQARAIARDPRSPPIDAYEALRRARTLDMALGGALAEEQTRWMRRLAPRAAQAYAQAGDRENAELARHTAQMAGGS